MRAGESAGVGDGFVDIRSVRARHHFQRVDLIQHNGRVEVLHIAKQRPVVPAASSWRDRIERSMQVSIKNKECQKVHMCHGVRQDWRDEDSPEQVQ